MKQYNEIITNIIKDLGIPASLKGYHYIRYAVELLCDDITLVNAITKQLYPSVAMHFKTTSSRVERAIRHAIKVGWSRGNYDMMMRLFGYSVSLSKGNPTNSEFLSTVADYILLKEAHPTEKGGG